jgi:hypothetical protein
MSGAVSGGPLWAIHMQGGTVRSLIVSAPGPDLASGRRATSEFPRPVRTGAMLDDHDPSLPRGISSHRVRGTGELPAGAELAVPIRTRVSGFMALPGWRRMPWLKELESDGGWWRAIPRAAWHYTDDTREH